MTVMKLMLLIANMQVVLIMYGKEILLIISVTRRAFMEV